MVLRSLTKEKQATVSQTLVSSRSSLFAIEASLFPTNITPAPNQPHAYPIQWPSSNKLTCQTAHSLWNLLNIKMIHYFRSKILPTGKHTSISKTPETVPFAKQKKRHRCIEQSFGLCGRRRGWDVSREQHRNMYII